MLAPATRQTTLLQMAGCYLKLTISAVIFTNLPIQIYLIFLGDTDDCLVSVFVISRV